MLLERIDEVHMLHTVHMLKTYSTHVYIRMLTVHVTYNTHVTCNTHVTYIGYCYTTKLNGCLELAVVILVAVLSDTQGAYQFRVGII